LLCIGVNVTKILKYPAAPEIIKASSDIKRGIKIFDMGLDFVKLRKQKIIKKVVLTVDNIPSEEKGNTP
jgi:hypothetical protein